MSGTNERKKGGKDRIGLILYAIYLCLLLASLIVVGRIIQIQLFFKPGEKVERALTPKSRKESIEPARGNILACDGRLLAMSCPRYDIHMDCTVLKEKHATMKDRAEGAKLESEWLTKARELSNSLALVFPEKTAEQHFKAIAEGRATGARYLRIGDGVDRNTYNRILTFPLFNEGRYRSGLIVEQETVREYPYGKLARRTIGFVRDNKSQVTNTHIGLEGKFDYVLHGKEGEQWLRRTDAGRIRDYDKPYRRAVAGQDIRTTLNIDYQDLADRALRAQIEEDADIEGGCVVLMDVKTGAIRAMVNLLRDEKTDKLEEISNLAVGRLGEPGSVFKTVTLTAALSDGKIKSLDETIPTNHGIVRNAKGIKQDVHILDHERVEHSTEISYLDGFKISSNYVFATIAVDGYADNPQLYMDKVYMYRLGEAFDFDLDGLRTPSLPKVGSRDWSNTTLGVVGYGYSTGETPLHILTFYNAIAGKGRMMKPYLVESVEKDGSVTQRRGPSVLNSSICTKAVADTLTRALRAVTEEGTAQTLRNAKCAVAGKTGTARIFLESGGYEDEQGRRRYQGTFVGFFPAEDPQYSIIAVVYSRLSHRNFYGGGAPARAVKEIVAGIVDTDPYWQGELKKTAAVPRMDGLIAEAVAGTVPDLSGLGLSDALWLAENSGLKCSYSGTGHVTRQHPAAGTHAEKGTQIQIELK